MLTSNVDIADKLINGQIGTVVNVIIKNESVITIYVRFDSDNVGTNKKRSDRLAMELDAVPINRVTTEIKTNDKKASSPIIKRTQFPLMLSWACTVHKVQGLSLSKAVISFDLLRQKSFNSGQMYVALSRVTSIDGMFLLGKFNSNAIVVDAKAKQEYEYLRLNQNLTFDNSYNRKYDFNFIVCNVRSLRKHIEDIKSDKAFTSSNIIFCTETQLVSENNLEELALKGYNLLCNNDPEHRFSSLAAYHDETISVTV